MVLESIMNPLQAEKHPLRMFLVGALYSSIAIFLSLWIFNSHASLVMVFLTVIATTPLMYNTIKMEEKKDITSESEMYLLKSHSRALLFFVMLFLGITFSFSIWYVALPAEMTSEVFEIQQDTIYQINGQVTGDASQEAGAFFDIFVNNSKVLFFCILFAFLYGVGAIFILVWNASVIATALGEFFRQKISVAASGVGMYSISLYFSAGLHSISRYAVHGIFEILAYFIAGLAGGIISIAVVNHDFNTKKFEKILFDVANLVIIAFVFLIIGAVVESFITPYLY